MATDKPRFTITLDDETFDRVEQFQSEKEYATRSKAIQKLVLRGLESIEESVQPIRNVARMPRVRSVPRLGAIACGEPILAEGNLEGYDEVPDYVKCDFTVTARGDSMTGARINDGDIVCIRAQEQVENGQIAAVLVGDEATLKRVRYVQNGVVLMPENSDYAPLVFTGDDVNRVRILGLATHFISKVL